MRITNRYRALSMIAALAIAAIIGSGGSASAQGYGNNDAGLGVVSGSVDGKAIAPSLVTTNGVITLTYFQFGAHGETLAIVPHTTLLTFPGGGAASEETAADFIPIDSTLLNVSVRVNVAGTTCSSFSIGDGSTADYWGHNISPALHTTNIHMATNMGNPQPAAAKVRITANGGNCVDLIVRVTIWTIEFTPPSLD